jgi:hypothetical protein
MLEQTIACGDVPDELTADAGHFSEGRFGRV